MKKLLVLVLMVLPAIAIGAMNELVTFLANEPASMLDIGLARFEYTLNFYLSSANLGRNVEYLPSVQYDYESNRIKVKVLISWQREEVTVAEMKEEVRRMFDDLVMSTASVSRYFRHGGYDTDGYRNIDFTKLDEITDYEVTGIHAIPNDLLSVTARWNQKEHKLRFVEK